MFTTPERNRARNGNPPQAPVKSLFDAGFIGLSEAGKASPGFIISGTPPPPSETDITADRGHFGCLTAAFWVMEDAAIGRCDAGPDVQAGAVGRPTKAVQEQTRERLGFPWLRHASQSGCRSVARCLAGLLSRE